MKKTLTILVFVAMVLVSVPAVANGPVNDGNQADGDVITIATMTGNGGGGEPGGGENGAPIIKVKWEYDMSVGEPHHDADPTTPGLQVKPVLGGNVVVRYFAVVTDPEGVGHVDHVYADIWHPDGEFKYQIELFPVGFVEGGIYDKQVALNIWNHVTSDHHDLLSYLDPEIYGDPEIYDELWEELAYIYTGEALINYCQPGGYYGVGVRAHDTYDAWCGYLFNQFWYIPTSAVAIDFRVVDYGTVAESINKWIGGDQDMRTPNKPTVRNIGNTPVELFVWQNDMDFGQTDGEWNVMFDARLGGDGEATEYEPFQTSEGHLGWRIPGILELCTKDKLDFSIHVFKGMAGLTFEGLMRLYAYIDGNAPWTTPSPFIGDAPNGVPQQYPGP